MIQFETVICPLCGTKMTTTQIAGTVFRQCPTFNEADKLITHYVVKEYRNSIMTQHVTIMPYCVDTYRASGKSRLYKFSNGHWNLLAEVDYIQPETEEKFLNRIHTLLLFL